MKKMGAILFTSFFISGIIFLNGTLYANKEMTTRSVLREAITWHHGTTHTDGLGLHLQMTTSLTVPPTYLQIAMNKLLEWGVPLDKGDPGSMALTGILLAVLL